ncbi:MAG: DUF2141 domain-containing protein [Sphingomonas sp.]
MLFLSLSGQAGPGEIDVQVQNLRNTNGVVRLCLTRNPAHFPNCDRDPAAVSRSVPARAAGLIRFPGLAPGIYALGVIHDENNNGRLDTFMAIPREGFGFSRNPRLRMGPPRFEEVRFQVGPGRAAQVIRMTYLL